MRRVTMMLAAMALMVSLFAAVAYAANSVGTDQGEILLESDRIDTIIGRAGGDIIDASNFKTWRAGIKAPTQSTLTTGTTGTLQLVVRASTVASVTQATI
jgi:hypothetical protein